MSMVGASEVVTLCFGRMRPDWQDRFIFIGAD